MSMQLLDSAPSVILDAYRNGWGQRQQRVEDRLVPPTVRLWDGDWNYKGMIADALEGSFQWKLNDTGTGYLYLPIDHWLGKWVMDYQQRTPKNVHVTMDKDGARWSGRLNVATITRGSDGKRRIELHFLHDYEEVKHIYVWPNPFLPAAVQFPRAFTLVGPTAWALKMALFLNVRRLAGHTWALPDDPFDMSQWAGQYKPQTWSIQVAPSKALLSDTSPWTVLSSRMKTWHDLAAPKLADAHLAVTCRRWLEGDPEPWEGAAGNIRHGTLIVDIEDKSGFWSTEGTATFGSIWKGLVRTVQTVVDHVDTNKTVLDEPVDVDEYKRTNWLSTVPNAPYVIYRDGALSGVKTAEFSWSPATTVQEVTGGHSTYGVNEAISAAVKLVGNYFGTMVLVPGLGSIADTFLAPIYADTILAWVSWKSSQRARELGWSHYFEHFADGADKAYTLSSLVAIRKGFWDTREQITHKMEISDGAPWFVGDNGKGHFFIGDRIGATVQGAPEGLVFVEQVTDLTYTFTRNERGWKVVCGDTSNADSPLASIISRVNDVYSSVHDLGVI